MDVKKLIGELKNDNELTRREACRILGDLRLRRLSGPYRGL